MRCEKGIPWHAWGATSSWSSLLILSTPPTSLPMLNRLLKAAALPVRIGELELQVSASLGITFYPQNDEVDADQLLRQADQAMYQAKLAGKNRYQIFDADQDRSLRGHHESLARIRRALTDDEFVLYYQPKVNLRTGKMVGAEALIRWQHPDKGLLSPAAFLPIIENHALALDVGEWVIHTATRQPNPGAQPGRIFRSASTSAPDNYNTAISSSDYRQS